MYFIISFTGPDVHLICGLTAAGVVNITLRRGSFTAAAAKEWMKDVLDRWVEIGNDLQDLLVVCDNAPCHSRLNEVFADSPAMLLKLGPYSPMLNPVESIWSKVKAHVKSTIRVPVVEGPAVGEQRIAYLENAIRNATAAITNGDCARAVQHASSFYVNVLGLHDMHPGT